MKIRRWLIVVPIILGLAGLGSAAPAEGAKAFVTRLNAELKRLWVKQATTDWVAKTYITDDTERLSAQANDEVLAYQARAIKEAMRFRGVKLDPASARLIELLRVTMPLAGPSDAKRREELATIVSKMEALYGKGKWCGSPPDPKRCRDLQKLSDLLRTSRKPDELADAWAGWHTIAREIRPLYARFVELGNQGAREIGFKDTGEMWRSGYDMTPAAFEKETDRLWREVKPLYDDLHCYVRAQLAKAYGEKVVPPRGPIPAHLLGNMWAQEWGNIYPLVEPYRGVASPDVGGALKRQQYDELRMVKLGESFFTSLGLDPLPKTFWERSMFKKPRDREVVCHASAWDVTYDNDLRIKMCVEVNAEDLVTIHHELGHNYYFQAYHKLPVLFQQGANDGFHEAIGDAIALSITPGYLMKLGLVDKLPSDDKGLVNFQMRTALDKLAFLPFGKLIDEWRWDVFQGKTKPADYNRAWWELRRRYQGVAPPSPRGESEFDPGAKYHIPANVPYTRYFLARILQFQFHRALCQAAGQKGPLSECSIYGSKAAGQALERMMELGASKPWPEALAALTGQRDLDASALIEYFAPLRKWLKDANAGRQCGW